ncbi:MAG: hypothetical protein IJ682_13440 [Lachnospiraceae bacterium]|nr:hypothetical protein [Lachnospiraceae bacterium]
MREIRAGDTVRLKKNAVSYNGRIISGRLKKGEWKVEKAEGDRAWLSLKAEAAEKKVSLTVNIRNIKQ